MPRIPFAAPAAYEPVFGADATAAEKVFAHSPEIALAYIAFGDTARRAGLLPFQLVELVRLRVAFHNQCRLCMSLRYESPDGAPVSEGLVCSLERPYDTSLLSEAERAAIACGEDCSPEAVRYLNRLSDLLFILSRGANGGDEPLWEPGRYR